MKNKTTPAETLTTIDKTAAPLRQKVLETLRLSIVHGRLVPGTRLVERELIDKLGVSRTVIREALRQLESEDLIDVVPNKGAVVRNLSLSEAKEIYTIRAVLEGLAARLFCENATAEQHDQLLAAYDLTAKAYHDGNIPNIIDSKNEFYDTLFKGAGSDTLYAMIGALLARIWRWRILGLAHPKRSAARSRESLNALRSLVSAIKKKDAALAESLAREEVIRAEAEVVRLVSSEPHTEEQSSRGPR